MKLSERFVPTLKETPSDAVVQSHILMLRAGLVRQLTAGVYSYLPLGYRVLRKIMSIVRDEMDAIGGQEFHLPALNPESLWIRTGRRNVPDFILSVKERELVLAPTHEEVIAEIAAMHIQSYKDLPQIWYQIQTKFRNEPRPRSGVLRTRQFTMKDSYSLDVDTQGLDAAYSKHDKAYRKIFSRCGLNFFVVGAATGAMGGSASQEFMIESEHGEDTVALCNSCGYAANIEIATSAVRPVGRTQNDKPVSEIHTPDVKTIDELAEFLKTDDTRLAKSLVYSHNGAPVLILMMGNDQLNESKLGSALGGGELRPIETEELASLTGADAGSIGPIGAKGMRIIADARLKGANGLVSGANKNDWHLENIDLARDVKVDGYFDLRLVEEGETCSKCGETLKVTNAIELGHIFKLGTKYSEALGARFHDEQQQLRPVVMGSYGIGIERVMAAFIEQSHDQHGIIWNTTLAPYHVHLIALTASEQASQTANELYEVFTSAGIDVLMDDRVGVSPGFKFKDADLLGMPLQIIVGEKGIKKGEVELKVRKTSERKNIHLTPKESLVTEIRGILGQL